MAPPQRSKGTTRPPTWASRVSRLRAVMVGVGRLCLPAARGVYYPQPHSPIVLGIAVAPETDLDALARRLWWRGLGLVERDGLVIAGADVTTAAHVRRMKIARVFVTQQLRDAGVRGPVKRWE